MNIELRDFLHYLAINNMPVNQLKKIYVAFKASNTENNAVLEEINSWMSNTNEKGYALKLDSDKAKNFLDNAFKAIPTNISNASEDFAKLYINGSPTHQDSSPYRIEIGSPPSPYQFYRNAIMTPGVKAAAIDAPNYSSSGGDVNAGSSVLNIPTVFHDGPSYWAKDINPELKKHLIATNPSVFGKFREPREETENNSPSRDEEFMLGNKGANVL